MLRRVIPPLTWAWVIIVGALLITPAGVICINCGAPIEVAGYIGRPAVWVIGVVSVALGILGFATMRGSREG